MAYMVDIVDVPVPEDDPGAWEAREDTLAHEDPERPGPSERFSELYRLLTAKFPCIMDDPDGPWSDGPLINNFGVRATTLGVSFSRVREVLPFLVETCTSHGFVVFDPQEERVFRPSSLVAPGPAQQRPVGCRKWWQVWKR